MTGGAFLTMLAALAASPAERVWTGPSVNLLGAPSRDGRYLSFVDRGDLAIRDLRDGTNIRLTSRSAGSREFAYFSVPSPNGTQVAYAWFNAEGFYELRVLATAGGPPATVFRNEDAAFIQPCAWSAGGEFILTLLFRRDNISQIALIPAQGGSPKLLRSLNWVYPKRMDLSPDGRYIAYDSFSSDGGGERAIFLLATDGTSETRITGTSGNFAFPLWTANGNGVVYARQVSTGTELLLQPMLAGNPDGNPQSLGAPGRALPLGIADRHLLYGLRTGGTDVFLAEIAAPTKTARTVTRLFAGLNRSPAFSPDGKRLAYLSRRGGENFGEPAYAAVIRDLDTDDEREVETHLAHLAKLRWASNDSLIAIGSDSRGRSGVYKVSLSGRRETVIEDPGADYRAFDAAGAGSKIVVRHGAEIRMGGDVLFRAEGLRALAASPDGASIAFSDADTVAIFSRADRSTRRIALPGVNELDWGHTLVALRGRELWIVPLDGGAPERIEAPGNLLPGFSLHGDRIALTAGGESAEVWRLKLP